MSDSEAELSDNDSGSDDGYVEPKFVPPPPPPRKAKAPPTPAEDMEGKLKLAIHKIGGKEITLLEMQDMWSFEADDDKFKVALASAEMQDLISTKLNHCAGKGNIIALQFLLEKGGDVNKVEEFTGNTALMVAVSVTGQDDKQKTVIKFLMEKGCDSNIKNCQGLCPKSAQAGFAVTPLVQYVREMDLKLKAAK